MMRLEAFRRSTKVAAILAFDGEANPIRLMVEAIQLDKQVFVPIIVAKAQPLRFAPWNPETELRTNGLGILEPAVDKSQYIEAEELDFVATPLVAFDESCNRIGVGGGYYDRTFAFLNEGVGNSSNFAETGETNGSISIPKRSVCLAGFAFELQKVDSIETNWWDVPMDFVVSETSVYERSQGT
jgi:5-formyltetrahydrofolate cyclo-ligase